MAIGDTSQCSNFFDSRGDYSIIQMEDRIEYTPDPEEMGAMTYGVAYLVPSVLLEAHVVVHLAENVNEIWEEVNALVINYKPLEAGWRLDITNAGRESYRLLYKDAQGNLQPVIELGSNDNGTELGGVQRAELLLVTPTVGPHAGKTIWVRVWM